MLDKVRRFGFEDFNALIKRFNGKVSTGMQLAGRKAMCVKLLVETWPPATWVVVRDHVGTVGWENSVFSEELLASKKLLPGHQFKAPNKLWASRSRMSEGSLLLALRRLICDFLKLPKSGRPKITRVAFEEMAERACHVRASVCLCVLGK